MRFCLMLQLLLFVLAPAAVRAQSSCDPKLVSATHPLTIHAAASNYLATSPNQNPVSLNKVTQELLSSLSDRRKLGAETRLETRGGQYNRGIHFSVAPDGSARVLKLLPWTDQDEWNLRYLAHELKNAYLAQKAGAPRFYGAGRVQLADGKSHYYLELEHIGHGQETHSLKGCNLSCRKLLQTLESRVGSQVPEQAADLILRALEHRLRVGDLDFLVTANGELRFVDTGQWEALPPGAPVDGFADRSLFTAVIRIETAYSGSYGNAIHHGRTERLLLRFLRSLKASAAFSDSEKEVLVGKIGAFFGVAQGVRELPLLKNAAPVTPEAALLARYRRLP